MVAYNAAERKDIREAEKREKQDQRVREDVLRSLADTIGGRQFLWEELSTANIFHTTYDDNPTRMAFNEGKRAGGLRLLGDIMSACPEQFIQAMREANVRRVAADATAARKRSSSEEPGRDDEGSSGGDPSTEGHRTGF